MHAQGKASEILEQEKLHRFLPEEELKSVRLCRTEAVWEATGPSKYRKRKRWMLDSSAGIIGPMRRAEAGTVVHVQALTGVESSAREAGICVHEL